MTLASVTAENVRCLIRVHLEPAQSNLIYGENASGKTSLLEALFILGRGRSFRTPKREKVVRDGETGMMVAGVVVAGDRQIKVGIGFERGKSPRIRVDGKDETSAAALAHWVPVQVIDPDIHQLVEQGPGVRRRYLDWGVFHVEPRFLDTWRRYHRIVRQRNAALRDSSTVQLDAWDGELSAAGEALSAYRERYTERLATHIGKLGGELLGEEPVVEYRRGWPAEKSLREALSETRTRDKKFGITHVGSHRSDLIISLASKRARGRVSRGQQKLLAATLILSQLSQLKAERDVKSILLLDDLSAELDRGRLARLRNVLAPLDAQVFMTALDPDDLPGWEFGRVFHVEQGKVRSVV